MQFPCTDLLRQTAESKAKVIVHRGGSSSSKTYSILQYWLGKLYSENQILISVVRATTPALKKSILRDWTKILSTYELWESFHYNKTDQTFTHLRTGSQIEFFALDDEQKARGPRRDYLQVNEANEIRWEGFRQLQMRTSKQTIIDFNPSSADTWIKSKIEEERAASEGDVEVIISNYKSNSFLSPIQVKEIESQIPRYDGSGNLIAGDEQFWKVFGLGEYGQVQGQIYTNWATCAKIPEHANLIGYGLDFGYTNDPTAIVSVHKADGELWIKELVYETRLTNQDISARMKELGMSSREWLIADSAEPKSIDEIKRQGWPMIKGAQKGGIDVLRRWKLNITADSKNLLKEIKLYRWAEDKEGVTLNKPVPGNDHAMDAMRYVALNLIAHKRKGIIDFY